MGTTHCGTVPLILLWAGPLQIFKFGCFLSIPIVMMTYFRIPENVGHYVNRVRSRDKSTPQ